MPNKTMFTFVASDRVYSVVERLDDVQLSHGFITGTPYMGGKFTRISVIGDSDKNTVYKIVSIDAVLKMVVVERV